MESIRGSTLLPKLESWGPVCDEDARGSRVELVPVVPVDVPGPVPVPRDDPYGSPEV